MAAPEERGAGGAAEEAFLTFYSEVPAAERGGGGGASLAPSSRAPSACRRLAASYPGGAGAWRAERSLCGGGRGQRGGARLGPAG